MNAVAKGFGDFQTWGGRDFDSDPAYEAWRGNVAIVDAIGADEATEILELLWGGKKDDAATRLAKSYGKAWDAHPTGFPKESAVTEIHKENLLVALREIAAETAADKPDGEIIAAIQGICRAAIATRTTTQ